MWYAAYNIKAIKEFGLKIILRDTNQSSAQAKYTLWRRDPVVYNYV
jgi:hypothetical protein